MKKSKVIIPAMAMILFSTAASISGTVAWFTANRVFNMTVSQFKVANLDGNLEATLAEGVGTTSVNNNTHAVTVPETNLLIDGSFNHNAAETTALHAFKLDTDGTNKYKDMSTASENNWKYTTRNSNKYYVAISWTISFKYTFADGETTDIGVYLDLANSLVTDPETDAVNSKPNAAKAFRIAFVNGGHNVVWAPLADENTTKGVSSYNLGTAEGGDGESHANKYTYVNSVSTVGNYDPAATGDTASKDFIYKGTTASDAPVDMTAGNTTRTDRVATIKMGYVDGEVNPAANTAKTGSTTVTCVAWFEGSDPNVVNSTVMNPLSASMKFYSRLDAA